MQADSLPAKLPGKPSIQILFNSIKILLIHLSSGQSLPLQEVILDSVNPSPHAGDSLSGVLDFEPHGSTFPTFPLVPEHPRTRARKACPAGGPTCVVHIALDCWGVFFPHWTASVLDLLVFFGPPPPPQPGPAPLVCPCSPAECWLSDASRMEAAHLAHHAGLQGLLAAPHSS